MCTNLPWGILVVFIIFLNIFIAFEVRTFPGFYPKEIIRESCRIFMCQDVPHSVLCNIKKKMKLLTA